MNYRRFGAQPADSMPLAWSIALTFALVSLAVRGRAPAGYVLPIVLAFGYWRYARYLQGAATLAWAGAGSKRQPWSWALIWAVALLIATAGVIVLGQLLLASAGLRQSV